MNDTNDFDLLVHENGGDCLVETVSAKLHGLRVTECKLDYHGSITIDADLIERARILPLEFVYIWNKASGARISTYVLPGPRGSGVVCLNGAAARTCQVGDEIIVSASRRVPESRLLGGTPWSARVLMFRHDRRPNEVCQTLEYRTLAQNGSMHFETVEIR